LISDLAVVADRDWTGDDRYGDLRRLKSACSSSSLAPASAALLAVACRNMCGETAGSSPQLLEYLVDRIGHREPKGSRKTTD
jgi:hypothetical protein